MRREGYIIEEIVEHFQHGGFLPAGPSRHVKRKRSRQGCYLLAHKPEVYGGAGQNADQHPATFRVQRLP